MPHVDKKKPELPILMWHCIRCNRLLKDWNDVRFGPPLTEQVYGIRCLKCWEKEAGPGVEMTYVQGKKLSHIERQEMLAKSLHPYVERFDAARVAAGIDPRQAAWDAHLRRLSLPPREPFDDPGMETGYSYKEYLEARFPGKYKETQSI